MFCSNCKTKVEKRQVLRLYWLKPKKELFLCPKCAKQYFEYKIRNELPSNTAFYSKIGFSKDLVIKKLQKWNKEFYQTW